jgi:hypothetical protein
MKVWGQYKDPLLKRRRGPIAPLNYRVVASHQHATRQALRNVCCIRDAYHNTPEL